MASLDTVYVGYNAPVVEMLFTYSTTGLKLRDFDEIQLTVPDDKTYSTLTDPDELFITQVDDNDKLTLSIGSTTSVDSNFTPTIVGISALYPDGVLFNSTCLNILPGQIKVCNC